MPAGRPRLIVLDARMASGDGYIVCARLRADPRGGTIPALMLTADPRVANRRWPASPGLTTACSNRSPPPPSQGQRHAARAGLRPRRIAQTSASMRRPSSSTRTLLPRRTWACTGTSATARPSRWASRRTSTSKANPFSRESPKSSRAAWRRKPLSRTGCGRRAGRRQGAGPVVNGPGAGGSGGPPCPWLPHPCSTVAHPARVLAAGRQQDGLHRS